MIIKKGGDEIINFKYLFFFFILLTYLITLLTLLRCSSLCDGHLI